MSYRDDLNTYKESRKKITAGAWLAIKITVIALAALFVLTTVMVIVDIAGGDSGAIYNDGGVDNEKPEIDVTTKDGKIYLNVGDNVSWKSYVSYPEGCTLKVDNSGVDLDKPGTYTVKYTAKNTSGVSAHKTVTVIVTKGAFPYSTLETTIKNLCVNLGITDNMSKVEKVRKVYEYVNSPTKNANDANIVFDNESNTPDIDRDNWEGDWVEEAIRTLNSGEGDCYSYYSVSKAFFTVLGIEHVGIRRDTSLDDAWGTHFWLVVNVGDSSNPKWYYYDATRLKYTFRDGTRNACLITLDKLQSYASSDISYDFYKFDPTQYPTVSKNALS